MKKRRVKRRLKVGRLILVIVLGIGLALGTYFGIRYLLKSNNDKPINKPSEEEKEKVYTASVITAGDNLIQVYIKMLIRMLIIVVMILNQCMN